MTLKRMKTIVIISSIIAVVLLIPVFITGSKLIATLALIPLCIGSMFCTRILIKESNDEYKSN